MKVATRDLDLRALKRALPRECFEPDTARALAYLLGDLALLAASYALAARLETPWAWPALWLVQGTLFWSLFVIGHDCGHGSFSRHAWLNAGVGHLTHTPLLVPYHAWRLSHRIHHRHVGDVERDETWFPMTERQLHEAGALARWVRLHALPLAFPLYLLRNTPARAGSHFDPAGPLFPEAERRRVAASVAGCGAVLLAWLAAAAWLGPGFVARHFLAPWLVFVTWAGTVTYLHHTDPSVPWYRGEAWSLPRGALATVDRRYGWLERVHHHAGHHVAHHLFPGIPHYRLRTATEALAPLLGGDYRRSQEPIWRALRHSRRHCHVVPEEGDVVFYAPRDPVSREAAPGEAEGDPA